MIRVSAPLLRRFAERVFTAMGANDDVAYEVGQHLVLFNLSGHDSHGIQRIPYYVELMDQSELDPAARPEVVRETPTSVLVDGHLAFGQFSTRFTLDRCAEKALRGFGIAVAAVRRSSHTGRMGTYSELAGARGLICVATTGAHVPYLGAVPTLTTSKLGRLPLLCPRSVERSREHHPDP